MLSPGLLFDPRTWPGPPALDEAVALHLSVRIDCWCLLDRQDHEWASRFLWCHTYGAGPMVDFGGYRRMARPDHIYARRCVGGATLWLHREILLRAAGPAAAGYAVGDHINGDTLDNRRCNLRWATRSDNARNRSEHRRLT